MPTPSDLQPVPTTHPDRDILYQLEDAVQKLVALPGDDWEWTVLRVGASGAKYVGPILEHREPIASGSVFQDKSDSKTAYSYRVLCKNAQRMAETEAWSMAADLMNAFDDLGKIGRQLMSRPFVTEGTDDLCRGFGSYRADTFWMFFVAGLSRQDENPVPPIPRVWQFESELGLRTLTAADIRNLMIQAAIPDLPKDWIESPPDDYFSFAFPAFGKTSVRVGRWLFDRILEGPSIERAIQRKVTRKQKKTTQSIVCDLVDWGSVKDEEQIQRALQILENQVKQVRDTLTKTTIEDPSISCPLQQLDEQVRIGATHPIHEAVEALLQCLPDSEWHIDKAGNRVFRNDGGLWATLCDISRLPVTSQAEYADKRLKMVDARQKFQQWIESEFLPEFGLGDSRSFATRIRRLSSNQTQASVPVPTRQEQPHSKSEMLVEKNQTPKTVDFQFDGFWLTADYCAGEFNLDDTNLSRWALHECPYLEGRRLRRQKFPPEQSRWCYHRVDIENIDSAVNGND